MKREKLHTLLTIAENAICNGDHEKLYQVITQVTSGVSDFATSRDVFIRNQDLKQ